MWIWTWLLTSDLLQQWIICWYSHERLQLRFFRWFLQSRSPGLMKRDSRAVVVTSIQRCCDSSIITEVPEVVSNRPVLRSLAMLPCRKNVLVSASYDDQIFKELPVFEVLLWVTDTTQVRLCWCCWFEKTLKEPMRFSVLWPLKWGLCCCFTLITKHTFCNDIFWGSRYSMRVGIF